MKIIIVGVGRTGCSLLDALQGHNYDITVIEKQKSIVDAVTDKYNVSGIVGSGASKETLLKAGADTADAFIALTPIDEINLLSCLQAKSVGAKRTAARVFQPDFVSERRELQKQHNIDYIIKPKFDIAEEIERNIGLPGIVKMEGYFDNHMQMVTISVTQDSPLVGKRLTDIKGELGIDILISTVIRDDKLYVPDGLFTIQSGDRIGVVAKKNDMFETLRRVGIVRSSARKILIVGGGITAEYLIELLLKDKKDITVIENNIERCRELMEKFPTIKVSYGKGEIDEVLEDEHADKADVLVSLTDSDENNLVTSMYAWSQDIPSIITRVDIPGHVKLLHKVNMDITLSPSEISVNKLMRFIRNYEVGDAPNDIGKYYSIADNLAEVLEFKADSSFDKLGVELKDSSFKLKKDVIIAAVIRDDDLIIPCGNVRILENDMVIVVTSKKNRITTLNGIFA